MEEQQQQQQRVSRTTDFETDIGRVNVRFKSPIDLPRDDAHTNHDEEMQRPMGEEGNRPGSTTFASKTAAGPEQQQQQQQQQQRVSRTFRDEVVATMEQVDKAPKGDLMHRHWECKHTEPLRKKLARETDIRAANQLVIRGHPTWERGLSVRPSLPLKRKSSTETFHWHVKPKGGIVEGDVYPDGSARDGPTPELMRLGWGFVVVGSDGNIAAAAYGVPPPWIVDIGGAEA